MESLQQKFRGLAPVLNERSRRLWAATEVRAIGYGGIALVERATGISRSTIERGLEELEARGPPLAPERIRRPGGGRKRAVEKDPQVRAALEALVEPTTSGAARLAAALDLEEPAPAGRGAEGERTPGEPSGGGGASP